MTNNQLAENSVIQLLNSVKLARDNAERADNRADHSFYYALTIALEELQERRKAAAAPQLPGSEPATVPGKWIPVRERMPENDGAYLCWDNRYVTTYAFIFGAWQANQFIAKNITHWMPLPAGPQEVR
ncbi:DUF551 domain-containing protein [Klebsiella pneumoniae]